MKKTFLLAAFLPMVYYSQVGINTSNPRALFHVDGAKDNSSTGAPTNLQQSNDFAVSSQGTVGIGITNPAARLHLYNHTAGSDVNDDYLFDDESPISNGHEIVMRRSNAGVNLSNGHTIGSIVFNAKINGSFGYGGAGIQGIHRGNGTAQNNALAFLINSNNEAGRFDEFGNLGVGITVPKEKLDVQGAISFAGQAALNKTAQGTIDYPNPGSVGNQLRLLSWGGDASTNGVISFWTGFANTNAVERMRIHSNGNVGIGTATPNNRLDLGASAGASPTDPVGKKLAVFNNPSGNDFYGLGVSPGLLQFHASSQTPTTAPGMVLSNVGNVGIGTTAPNSDASLDLGATNKAFMTNRVASPSAIANPSDGMIIFDTTAKCFKGYANSLWRDITPCSGGTPIVTQLNCGGGTLNGSFTSGTSSNSTFSLPYAGGNGVAYTGQTIFSTGVTGLTATLNAGTLANGSGSLTYTISGTPSSSGTANFTVNFGGQLCAFNVNVSSSQPQVTQLLCGSGTHNGSFTSGAFSMGSFSLPYAGGNGVAYSGQTISSTGVTGLTATLSAGTLANGSGSLTYTISGTPSSSGTANFTVNFGGQICTFSVSVNAPAPTLKCGEAVISPGGVQISGPLHGFVGIQGTQFNQTVYIPYSGGNGQSYASQTTTSTGFTGISATLQAGVFVNGDGYVPVNLNGYVPPHSNYNLYPSWVISVGGTSCNFSTVLFGN